MKRYENKTSAPLVGAGAVLMSAIVLTLSVYLPAQSVATVPVEVAIEPARIEVVGVRTARTAPSAHVNEARTPSA